MSIVFDDFLLFSSTLITFASWQLFLFEKETLMLPAKSMVEDIRTPTDNKWSEEVRNDVQYINIKCKSRNIQIYINTSRDDKPQNFQSQDILARRTDSTRYLLTSRQLTNHSAPLKTFSQFFTFPIYNYRSLSMK